MISGKSSIRFVILVVAAVMVLTITAPVASFAGSTGRRNTAIGLAAAGAYLLIKGKTTPGIAAAGGALYSYKRYKDARDAENDRDRYWSSRDRYRSSNQSRYAYNNDRDRYDRDNGRGKEHLNRGKHLGWENQKSRGRR